MQPNAWHIETLTLDNFRAYERLSVAFQRDLNVLIGLNGEGKTSILDALSIALGPVMAGFGQGARGFQQHDARVVPHDMDSATGVASLEAAYPVRAATTATLDGTTFTWTRERVSAQGRTTWGDGGVRKHVQRLATLTPDSGTALPVLAYYGVERLVGVRRDRGKIPTSRLGAYEAALDPKSDLTRLAVYLESLTQRLTLDIARERAMSQPVRAQLDAIETAAEISLSEFGWHRPAWDPIVGTITLQSTNGASTLPLEWLSSGVRVTAGLVIDLASRMARANPHLGGRELLDQTPGIVLIDEVDLHLHPQWQHRIVGSLRTVFPRVQFIVTTHSPQVLSTVPARCIKILDEKEVSTPEFSEGLRSDVILNSLQETRPEPPTKNRQALDQYLDLVHADQGKSAEAMELRRRLDADMGGVALVPELGEADAYMAVFGGE